MPASARADMQALHTAGCTVLALPVGLGEAAPEGAGRARFEAWAIPGRDVPEAPLGLLLRAADGIVFLPDRLRPEGAESVAALGALLAGLARVGRGPGDVPIVRASYTDGDGSDAPTSDAPGVGREGLQAVSLDGDTLEGATRLWRAIRAAVLARQASGGVRRRTRPAGVVRASWVSRPRKPVRPGRPSGRWTQILFYVALVSGASSAALFLSLAL
jgi:hypothetical protein